MTLNLDTLKLAVGSHSPESGQVCLMEAVSLYLDQTFSDHPAGVSDALGAYGRVLNDRMPDEWRAKLVPLIPRIAACDSTRDQARAYLAADWAVRVVAPLALDARGLTEQAASLRALPQLVDRETCLAGGDAAAAAAYDYAYAYAYAAAAGAAYDYAAAEAAAYAVYAAAADAAYAPVWESALDLFERMIEAR